MMSSDRSSYRLTLPNEKHKNGDASVEVPTAIQDGR